jgi:hypothetical protein
MCEIWYGDRPWTCMKKYCFWVSICSHGDGRNFEVISGKLNIKRVLHIHTKEWNNDNSSRSVGLEIYAVGKDALWVLLVNPCLVLGFHNTAHWWKCYIFQTPPPTLKCFLCQFSRPVFLNWWDLFYCWDLLASEVQCDVSKIRTSVSD